MQKDSIIKNRQTASWSDASVQWLNAVMQERYGLPLLLKFEVDRWVLSLAGSESLIHIHSDPVTFQRADSDLPFTSWDADSEGWHQVLGKAVPAPGISSLPTPLIEKTNSDYLIHYDVLGLAYWVLVRQEEVGRNDLDEHQRFPAKASHAYKHSYLERPVVDEWLDVLGQVMQRTWPTATLKQNRFSIKVSHDVDRPSRYGFASWKAVLRAMAGDLLKRQDARGLLGPWIRLTTRSRLQPLDPFNTFDWLMDISEKKGLTSAFYFICDRRGTGFDSDYDLGHPAIRSLIRRIHERGHEIGLHPSYNTFLKPEQIATEVSHLHQVCTEEDVRQAGYGGRMHYLQWAQPTTLRAWDNADMLYDSTMSYADHAGFRCGTCFEYPAFDPVAQKALQLRIRPLVAMEGSVLGANYMNLSSDTALVKMRELKNSCKSVGGCFTLLWHNSSLSQISERKLYSEVLAD